MLTTAVTLLLTACTQDTGPSSIAPTPSAGNELVCGIDPAAIELATGYRPDRLTNSLTSADGRGAGTCEAFSDDKSGELLTVEFHGLESSEAIEARQRMAGRLGSAPRLVYAIDTADGAVWGADDAPGPRRSASANAEIFWGRTNISIYISPAAANRNGADDLLNLAYQVIDTYDLERPEP